MMPVTSEKKTTGAIIGTVTDFYRVKITDLQSKRRQRSVLIQMRCDAGYVQPGYGQPGYGQPGYGYPGQ